MNIFDFDLPGFFSFTVPALELLRRGTLLYWLLFIFLRFVLRRDVGSLGVGDFLWVVLLGQAAQYRLMGSATSADDWVVLIGALLFWSCMLDFVSRHVPLIQRLTSAPRVCLVRHGKLLRRNMRRQFITDEELNAKIRHEGVADIANVKCMYLETDGQISLVRYDQPRVEA
jgi:uncharacterized membrane protein YcaP (DUF421 family)